MADPVLASGDQSVVQAVTRQFPYIYPCKELTPFLLIDSLYVLEGCNEVTPQPSLLKAEQTQLPQPIFVGEVLQTFDYLSGLPLDPFQPLLVLLILGASDLHTVLQMGPREGRVERDNPPCPCWPSVF